LNPITGERPDIPWCSANQGMNGTCFFSSGQCKKQRNWFLPEDMEGTGRYNVIYLTVGVLRPLFMHMVG